MVDRVALVAVARGEATVLGELLCRHLLTELWVLHIVNLWHRYYVLILFVLEAFLQGGLLNVV